MLVDEGLPRSTTIAKVLTTVKITLVIKLTILTCKVIFPIVLSRSFDSEKSGLVVGSTISVANEQAQNPC